MKLKKRVLCAILAFVLCLSALSISALPLSAESELATIDTFGIVGTTIDLTAFKGIENYIGQGQYPYWVVYHYTIEALSMEWVTVVCADEPLWAMAWDMSSNWRFDVYLQVSSRVPSIIDQPITGLTWGRDIGADEWTLKYDTASSTMTSYKEVGWYVTSFDIPYYDMTTKTWPGDYFFARVPRLLLLPNTPDPYSVGFFWHGSGQPASDNIDLRNFSALLAPDYSYEHMLILKYSDDRYKIVTSSDPIEVRVSAPSVVRLTSNALSVDMFYDAYIWDMRRNEDTGQFEIVGDFNRGMLSEPEGVIEYWTRSDIPVYFLEHGLDDYNSYPYWVASTGRIYVSDVPEEPEEPDEGGFWPWWKEQWLSFRAWLSDGFDRIVEAIQGIGKNSPEEDETSFFDVVKMCIDAIKSLITGFFGFVVKGVLELIKGTFGDMFDAFNSFSVGDWL